MKKKTILFLALLCAVAQGTWAWSGSGTQADPYLITSTADWNTLATNVNGGTSTSYSYSGKYFKLTNDISVTTMVGGGNGSNNVFQGIFDGNGCTITFNVAEATEQYIAPFRRIDGATIKNLKLEGTVSSSNRFAGGIVAYAKGTSTVTNCINSTSITSTANSNASNGGIVGMVGASGTLNILGCVFNGQMSGSSTSNDNWSGILGLCNSGCTANISNCLVDPISAVEHGNTIYRSNGTTDLSNCYYTKTIGNAQGKLAHSITGGSGISIANVGTATVYNVSGITGYGVGIKYNDVLYAGDGESVSLNLGCSAGDGYTLNDLVASSGTLTGSANPYTLTMPNADVTITATVIANEWTGSGTQADPYLIKNEFDWGTLAYYVGNGNTYSGLHFKLTADISVTTMVGTSDHTFNGTFDGDGHTIDVNYTTSADGCGAFCHTNGATIKNLITTGTITTSNKHAGGVVGLNGTNKLTLENVKSSVTINTTTSDADSEGGLVGQTISADIIGCAFVGSLLGQSGGGWGGLIGYKSKADDSSVIITNCLFAPASMSENRGWSGTFARYIDNDINIKNSYYTVKLNGDSDPVDGKLRHSITGDAGVSVECADSPTEYNVSGITAYSTISSSNGEVLYAGIKFDGVLYAGVDDYLNFNVGCSYRNDYVITGSASATGAGWFYGSSNPYRLRMNDADVTISAPYAKGEWEGSGTEADPYLIYNSNQLDWLATRVNEDGNDYKGKYFKLMDDITYSTAGLGDTESNFTAIGTAISDTKTNFFQGHFNGNGKTISGIRIYKGGHGQTDYYQGLFGYISTGAEVKNVTLTDARIAGRTNVGGIVGYNENGTIDKCHVTSSVIIRAVVNDAFSHGGIVGCNYGNKTYGYEGEQKTIVSNCSSAATLTVEGNLTDYNGYGGIIGDNYIYSDGVAIVSNNVVVGATLPATGAGFGAVAGSNSGTLENNYYTGCTAGGVSIANGVGCNGADVSTDNGAMPALCDDADNTDMINYLAALPASVGTYGVSISGRTLYKDGYWNTLCLPFDLSDGDVDDQHFASTGGVDGKTFTGTPLEGAEVMNLDISNTGFDRTTGTLTLNFVERKEITAGSPYIVRWGTPENPGGADIENPVFPAIRIGENINPDQRGDRRKDVVRFGGTFKHKNIYTAGNFFLYLGANNTLYYPTDPNFEVNAFRAYFELLGDLSAGTSTYAIRAFVLNFGDDEMTGIENLQSSMLNVQSNDDWYSIDGRRLAGKPIVKGIYIHGGKKVVIK